jgi:predicted nucleic acid-binding protein
MLDKPVLLDSNVIIYAYSDDDRKKNTSKSLLRTYPIISTQVINEVINVGFRKLKLSNKEVQELFDLLNRKCDVKIVECSTIERALTIAEIYRYSYFDSLIIASALEHHCRTLYSEDLQHGQVIEETLTIENPFVEL